MLSQLHAREILDSRGNPTVEVECVLSNGALGRAAVPSGASTGSLEALELRDGDRTRYGGKGVRKAALNVNTAIAKALGKFDISDQRKVDRRLLDLDDTPNKSKLGANAILGASMAVAVARARSEHRSLFRSLADQFAVAEPTLLPVPLVNVINGGAHADSGLAFQEFMIVPTGFDRFSEALRAAAEIFYTLKQALKKAGHVTAVGDEGGFAPHLPNNSAALDLLVQAVREAGYEGRVQIALDTAASEFCDAPSHLYTVDGRKLGASQLLGVYEELVQRYPIVSIEDGFGEDDWEGFVQMTKELGDRLQIVGDDLFVTNVARIEEGIAKRATNAVLIKLNQIGTVSETVNAIQQTQAAGWNAVVSHRSGETEDTFIADLSVALRCGQIKTGSMSRSERLAKYNQLLRIEEELEEQAEYRNPFA